MPAKTSSKTSLKKKPAPKTFPCAVICRFTVKPGREKDFLKLLSRDWPGLLRMGLATKDEPAVYRHVDESGGPVFFQIFNWANADAMRHAHENAGVMESWNAMEPLCEERCGHKKWEFPHVEQIAMNWVGLRGLSGATGRL